jgi:hypothetical protein
MAPFQYEWFRAVSPSLVAVEHRQIPARPRFWLEAVKGTSKTTMVAACVLHSLAFSPEPMMCEAGARDREQAAELAEAANDLLRCNPFLKSQITIQVWDVHNKSNGARCDIRASDQASAHGSRPWLVCLDELVHHYDEKFALTMLDNLTKQPHGLAIICTNSGFVGSWQHQWRERYRHDARWHFTAVNTPPPWIPQAALREAEQRNPRSRWLRLFCGIWTADDGDCAINDDDLSAAVTMPGPMHGPEDGFVSFVAGLDLAYRRDRSALVILACDRNRQRVRLAYVREWSAMAGRDIDLTSVADCIRECQATYGITEVFADETQCILMGQQLAEERIFFHAVPQAGKPAAARAMCLVDAFKSRIVDLYDSPQLIRDLKKLRIVERSGNVRLDASRDESGHADLGFAFSFALEPEIQNAGRSFRQFFSGRSIIHAIGGPDGKLLAGDELQSAVEPAAVVAEVTVPEPDAAAVENALYAQALRENGLDDVEAWNNPPFPFE